MWQSNVVIKIIKANVTRSTSSFLSIKIRLTIRCSPIPKLELVEVVSNVLTSVMYTDKKYVTIPAAAGRIAPKVPAEDTPALNKIKAL